jgi:HNH endonuclease
MIFKNATTKTVSNFAGCFFSASNRRGNMLTASRLRKLLSYNRATGVFRWLVRPAKRILVDSVAGSKRRDGFIKIGIDEKSYLAHHLAVLHVTGRWPNRVAFRNLDRNDTRWRNLRFS